MHIIQFQLLQNIRIENMEQDDFYQSLPYVLAQDQITPEYVIFGTGLQECLIAAYKSKMESKIGLIIDTQKTYGSSLKTVTLKQFHELSSNKSKQKMYEFVTPTSYLETNQKFFDQCLEQKKHRGYNIDIEPNLFLGSSTTCQCLKQADMDKYMDFHLVNNIFFIHNNAFRPVPLSKGKIFESKELSLLQKKTLLMSLHKLIKIYQRWMKLEEDLNSTKQFDKDFGDIDESLYNEFVNGLDQYFLPFVQKLVKKNKNILNYLTYIICNYQYNINKTIPEHAAGLYTLKGFIEQFGKFIKSCGIYGESPYLYVDNGIGDIPQAFSRIASIYGSIYILHPKVKIDSIQKEDEFYCIKSNLSPQKPIKTKQIFYGPTYLDLRKVQEQFSEEKILRVLVLCQKAGKQQSCPAICFITDLVQFVNPVYLFMFDSSTQSCPENIILHQFETILEDNFSDINVKAQVLLATLQKIYGQSFRGNIKYYSTCIRTRRYPKQSQIKDKSAIGLNDTMGIDLDQHFANFIQIIGTKDNYFKKDGQNHEEEQQPFGGYDTNYLLQKLQGINIKSQPLQIQQKDKQAQTVTEPTNTSANATQIPSAQAQLQKNEQSPSQAQQ